jgi:RNA polymerase sigma-70 factor (ECF subfamily)
VKTTSLTLLERVRGGDQDAWHRLFNLYGPLVLNWCERSGVSGADADDVRQDVFRAVATGLQQFKRDRPEDTFRGWLRVVTRSKLINHVQRKQKHPEAQGGTEAQLRFKQIAEQDLPEDSPDQLSALYHRALELVRLEFEDSTWQAFWRAAVDGHSPALIASEMGVTTAAVRKAKSRVLNRLREELGDLIA